MTHFAIISIGFQGRDDQGEYYDDFAEYRLCDGTRDKTWHRTRDPRDVTCPKCQRVIDRFALGVTVELRWLSGEDDGPIGWSFDVRDQEGVIVDRGDLSFSEKDADHLAMMAEVRSYYGEILPKGSRILVKPTETKRRVRTKVDQLAGQGQLF